MKLFYYSVIILYMLAVMLPLEVSSQATKTTTTTTTEPPATVTPAIRGIKIRLDLNAGAFLDPLPFDVPFKIIGLDYDSTLLSVKLYYKKKNAIAINPATDFVCDWQQRANQKVPFILYADKSLKPNTSYIFQFSIERKLNADELNIVKGLISGQLSAILNQRLSAKQNFELTRQNIDDANQIVINALRSYLQQHSLTLNTGALNLHYYELMTETLVQLTKLYEDTYITPLQEAKLNKTFITTEINNLAKVALEPGLNAADYADLVNKLQILLGRIDALNQNAVLSANDLDNLISATQNSIAALKPSVSPNSPNYKSIMADAVDILNDIDEKLQYYKNAPANTKSAIEKVSVNIAGEMAKLMYSDLYVSDDTYGTYQSRAGYYLSADIGAAFFPTIGRASPYLGTNIYLRPVNKERPIYYGDYNPFRCFSFLVGISFITLNQTDRREDLLGNTFNLLTGIGYRITDNIRINGGYVFYKATNTNPLIGTQKIGTNGFISVSFDWDVNSAFKSLFKPPLATP